MSEKLPDSIFRNVVESTPLVAIDLCIVNAQQKILLGYRTNRPAKSFWFVPGGRIRKGEALVDAFNRIAQQELGFSVAFEQKIPLGIYEHFYNDNFYDDTFATHYVVLAYALVIEEIDLKKLPSEQHDDYRLVPLNEFMSDEKIHENSRAYAAALRMMLPTTF